jgi:hypothetical protein
VNLSSPEDIARELKGGNLPAVPSWLIAKAAEWIADELARSTITVTVEQVRLALRELNDQRYFSLARAIAEAWMAHGAFDAIIQKRRVQALIDTACLDDAMALANDGVAKCRALLQGASGSDQLDEFRSLLGRIAKQRFVNSDDRDRLREATDIYHGVYKDNLKNYYPAINALACLMLELQRDALRAGLPEPTSLASEILALIKTSTRDSWEMATASEAHLALSNCDAAELWLYRFLSHEKTTPFQIDSYARQLREIWGGSPLGGPTCADRLSGIIARFVAGSQGRVTVAPSQIPQLQSALASTEGAKGLEKNFLGESSFDVDSIRRLLKAFASIGCIMSNIGERLGTGFLVRGSWLKGSYGDGLVFVTNAHVISDTVAKAIPPNKARVTFELEEAVGGKRSEYSVSEVLFTSAPGKIGVPNPHGDELDCTIVRLDRLPPTTAPLFANENLPLIEPLAKAFVAGHPRGAGLQIALHDSRLLDIDDDDRLVHYRTPTDPGSSGSPVFNADWQVIALHHAGTSETPRLHGSGTYEANEGVSMGAIRRKLNRGP